MHKGLNYGLKLKIYQNFQLEEFPEFLFKGTATVYCSLPTTVADKPPAVAA